MEWLSELLAMQPITSDSELVAKDVFATQAKHPLITAKIYKL